MKISDQTDEIYLLWPIYKRLPWLIVAIAMMDVVQHSDPELSLA